MDEIIDLNLGIFPEAAVSGAVLVQTDCSMTLTFNAMRPTDKMSAYGEFYRENAGIAIFRFKNCFQTRFGIPSDEARGAIPRFKDETYGIYEVQNSTWIQESLRDNRYKFLKTRDDFIQKHLLFTFHDSTFECLVHDFAFELSTEPYAEIFDKIKQWVLSE